MPAVEYIQANRARTLLMQEMDRLFEDMDVFLGSSLSLTNLTGHPEVVLPNGDSNVRWVSPHDGTPPPAESVAGRWTFRAEGGKPVAYDVTDSFLYATDAEVWVRGFL